MTACSGGCVLVIVGSLLFDDSRQQWDEKATPDQIVEAQRIIESAFDRHRPRKFISGGAAGIDWMAEREAAKRLGRRNIRVYRPGIRRFHGEGGYRERDEWMADDAECLVRIAHARSKTYGSGYTADQAEKRGANVERYVVGTK